MENQSRYEKRRPNDKKLEGNVCMKQFWEMKSMDEQMEISNGFIQSFRSMWDCVALLCANSYNKSQVKSESHSSIE